MFKISPMTKLLLLMLFLIRVNNQLCDLYSDLKKDKKNLSEEHGEELNKDILTGMHALEKYGEMNLADFEFKSEYKGKYAIFRWRSRGNHKVIIYEIRTAIHVDTVIKDPYTDIDDGTRQATHKYGKEIPVKGTYQFHIYVIKPYNGSDLIYITETSDGVQELVIGNKEQFPEREAVPLYMPRVSLTGIRQLLN